ncbi:MAG: TAXI family TRAP transporter solute-binding subunit [Vicinamibacterales bacterium]
MTHPWYRRLLAAGIACLSLVSAACEKPSQAATPRKVVLSIPFSGGAWENIGKALSDEYAKSVPNITTEMVKQDNLESQVDAVQAGSVDLALEDAETAYLAFSRGTVQQPTPHDRLRAVAVMFSIAVQVAVPAGSGIERIDDLRGRRVDIGAPGSAVNRSARIILESYGIHESDITPSYAAPDTLEKFRDGQLDARFYYSAFKHPGIDSISHQLDVRVLPIDRARLGAIQEQHHFLKLTTIPAGTYPKQAADVQTVGMDVLLLCRQELPDTLVFELTRSLFASVPALERAHEAARAIDPERGPTASIPLHPGAARYYRAREILQ